MVQIAGAVLLILLTLAARESKAADLVVWWDKPFYAQEDDALREVIAAFEQRSGKRVELDHLELTEFEEKLPAAIEAGRPPDLA
jgi:multiple sugar transport system substrate-binding protein